MLQMPLILADLGDLLDAVLPFAVFVLIVIGSIIKSIAEARRRKSRKSAGEGASPPAGSQPTTRQRMDEMAEQRKRQLQELARRRRETTIPQRPTAERGPAMPSDQQRRSQEESDRQRRRAEALRQAQQRRQGAGADRASQQQQRQRIEQARHREAERLARQMRDLERQRQAAVQRQQDDAARMAVSVAEVGHETEQVHRHVPDVAAPARQLTGHAAWVRQLAGAKPEQLQRAIILKEILDQPLAMRDPFALPMER